MRQLNIFLIPCIYDILGSIISSIFTWWVLSLALESISTFAYFLNATIASILVISVGYQTGMLHPNAGNYVGINSLYKVAFLVISFATLHFLVLYLVSNLNFYHAVRCAIIESMSSGLILLLLRVIRRNNFKTSQQSSNGKSNIIIYGAGQAGEQLLRALIYDPTVEVKCFIDDNLTLLGRRIGGKRIYSPLQIQELIEKYNVANLIIAIPSAPLAEIQKICDKIAQFPIKISTLPHLTKLATGAIQVSDVREINLDDLLGREVVGQEHSPLQGKIFNKIVLVTGAGGSIGSELCRQILRQRPAKIILLDNSEFALFTLLSDLRNNESDYDSTELIGLLRDVTDKKVINDVFSIWVPDTVFHAAAYKHVPIVEENVCSGVSVNIFGTLNVVTSALQFGTKNFVLISTDKAVNPTNIMGATKRVAELIVQAAYESPKEFLSHMPIFFGLLRQDSQGLLSGIEAPLVTPIFSMVRFGNVLGSSGSVVPIFLKQIADGGPVKITHPDIVRYFMTIPEAAQLVIQANEMAIGGDVFILDMGEPRKILDLAKKLIHLAGHKIKDEYKGAPGISIEFTGLRAGEKLYEELLVTDKAMQTKHPRIFRAKEDCFPSERLFSLLAQLDRNVKDGDIPSVYNSLASLVEGFNGINKPVDFNWCAMTNHS